MIGELAYIVNSKTGFVEAVADTYGGNLRVATRLPSFQPILKRLEDEGLIRSRIVQTARHRFEIVQERIPLSAGSLTELAATLPPPYVVAREDDVELVRALPSDTRDGRQRHPLTMATQGYVLKRKGSELKPVGTWTATPDGIMVETKESSLKQQIRKLRYGGVKTLKVEESRRLEVTKPYRDASYVEVTLNLEGYVLVPRWGIEK